MNRKNSRRITNIYFIFFGLFLALFIKIIYLQVFKSNFFQSLAQNQHYRLIKLEGKRGNILDRQGRVLATGLRCYSVFADPKIVSDLEATAKKLSTHLDLPAKEVLSKLKKDTRFVWIKRRISLEDKQQLSSAKLKGIGFIREEKRFYPQDELAAAVIGISGIDNNGLEGLELLYDDYLSGKHGWGRVLQDSASQEIILSSQVITPQGGADVVLSLDAQIQYWVEKYLGEAVEKYKADAAQAVVMDALTGQILALANYPGFNPNELGSVPSAQMRNKAISDMFEPGSVFKVVTLLAATAGGKISNQDIFFCEDGKFKIPGTTLHDWKPYGDLSFKEVFMKSSNIGVAKIVQTIGPQVFYSYVKKLGFGNITGIDLPAETEGLVKPIKKWSKTSAYIMPIGQEIGVNLLQLARAFATVVNGGYLVRPYVVKSICSGQFCKETPEVKEKVITDSTAQRAKNILIEVVEEGTGKRAGLRGRKIGGKTGTAQKYDPQIKRYSPSKYRATFVGFVADVNPPLVIGITVDEPKRSHFGGVVAAPVFHKIAEKVIKYTQNIGI